MKLTCSKINVAYTCTFMSPGSEELNRLDIEEKER